MEVSASVDNIFGWHFEHSYTQLPESMFARVKPTPVKAPELVLLNQELAEAMGLTLPEDKQETIAALLAGNTLLQGTDPIAQAYMGHQFGFPNMLGDGRAILLGEHLTPGGDRLDIQLKGAGVTQYSRRGDGRSTLGAMLREYIISEAMHYLGIPTTRSLAVVATGEPVYRETIQSGAVLTRVAASHIRVGTFEFATRHLSRQDFQTFTHYVIKRHYPELLHADNPALALLKTVIERQASLITQWMRVGFIHGVMNTDNMSIAGETIDYGPCAFMNSYDPATVFSSIDTGGRYAYGNQPTIAKWNLAVFASTLLPLIDDNMEKAVEIAKAAIHDFTDLYAQKWLNMMRQKIGLPYEMPGDKKLVDDLLQWMQQSQADYTNTFYTLSTGRFPEDPFYHEEAFIRWYAQWKERLTLNEQPLGEAFIRMRATNPAFIARNHRVEEALQAATLGGDLSLVRQLIAVLRNPYDYSPEYAAYQQPPAGGDGFYKTFCGT